ncbi:hypothetical protein GCM10027421_31710 [Microbacterium shaanxiense]
MTASVGGGAADAVRRRYREYLEAFNGKDLVALEGFLSPDIVFEWGDVMDDLVGREAFFSFYRTAWQYLDENVSATIVSADDERIVADVRNELTVVRDWTDSPLRPYRAGETHSLAGLMTYDLRDGMIVRIS